MKLRAMGLAIGLFVAMSGCERSPSKINPPNPNTKKPSNDGSKIPSDTDDGKDSINGQSALKTTLYAQSLSSLGINVNALSYKFSYLTVSKSDAIKFVDDKAELSFAALPSKQSGTLVLEIYEGTKLQLKGTKEGLSLEPGSQKIDLKLQFVGSVNPATSDLVVSIEIDQTTIPVTPTPSVSPVATQIPVTPIPTVTPIIVVTPNPTPTVSFVWDGLSFKGNDKWEIVPVSN